MTKPTLLLALLALLIPATAQGQTGGAAAPDPDAVLLYETSRSTAGADSPLQGIAPAGSAVAVERFDVDASAWVRVAAATAGSDGTWAATWRPAAAGPHRLRALRTGEATASSTPREVTLTVYRRALATYFGPGLFGRRTACGHTLTRKLHGVAHKTLPCGTQVALRYGDRSLVVPVVDRGPFRRGTSYDLTAATAAALGFTFTDRIGAIARRDLPRARRPR